jgi:hypothetical protein
MGIALRSWLAYPSSNETTIGFAGSAMRFCQLFSTWSSVTPW